MDWVKYGHSISNSDFDVSQTYLSGLLVTPVILFVLGVLSIVFLNRGFSWSSNRYKTCSFELSSTPPPGTSVIAWVKKIDKTGRFYGKALMVTSLFIFLIEQCMLFSLNSLNNSIQETLTDAYSISEVFNKVNLVSLDMKTDGNILLSACNRTNTCLNQSNKTNLLKYIITYQSRISDYQTLSQNIVNFMNSVTVPIDNYGAMYSLVFISLLYIVGVVSSILFFFSQLYKSAELMRYSRIFSHYVLGYIVLMNFFVLLSLSSLSDFCVSPATSLSRLSLTGGGMLNVTTYYLSCPGGGENSGSSKMSQSLYEAKAITTLLNKTLYSYRYSVGSSCISDSNILTMKKTTSSIFQSISSIQLSLHCSSIQALWKDLSDNALCNDLLTALVYMWISQIIAFILVFIAILLGSITFHYFDRLDLTLDSEPDDAEDYAIENNNECNDEGGLGVEEKTDCELKNETNDLISPSNSVKVAWPALQEGGDSKDTSNRTKLSLSQLWNSNRFRRRNKVDAVSFVDDFKDSSPSMV